MLKKYGKRLTSVMIAFAMVFSLAASPSCAAVGGYSSVAYVSTSDSTVTWTGEDGIIYTFDTSTGTITNASITSPMDVVIPSEINGVEVVAINNSGFYENDNVLSVTFPSSVKTIADYTFGLCENLTTVIFETSEETITDEGSNETTVLDGITSIGEGVFWCCYGLTSVTLPDSLEEIDNYTFMNCTSLEEIVIPDNVTFIGEHAFGEDTSLKSVTLGESVTTMEGYVFFHCYALEEIVMPDSAVYIGEHAFNYCTSLTSVTFGNSLQIIDDSAFWFCGALTDLVMPDSLETIGDYAFRGCTSLQTLQLNEGLLSIGVEAFKDCTSIEELVLPDSLVLLGDYAFQYCSGIKSLVIGSGLTEIGTGVFDRPNSLESIEFRGTVTSIGEEAFYVPMALTEISFPNGLLAIGTSAFAHGNIEKIVIPSSVTEIADEAFYTNNTLTEAWIYSRDVVFGTDVFTWASDEFTIYGYAGSTAEAYAEEYSFNFVDIESFYRDLTVTVCDSEGNTFTDGYTVTWYDEDGTVLLEEESTLSDADASQSYIAEVTLDSDLLESYEQPEQCVISPEDEADCVITLSPISKITLTGQITDADGNPLSDVTVTATRSAYGTEYTVQTDADGTYSVEVSCDSLTVKMQKDGYYSHRETIDLSGETAESYDLSYALIATVTDRIVLDITAYSAVAEGEEATGKTLTSANTLNFTLTDADGNAITEYEVQGTAIVFEPDVVSAGEAVTVAVSDATSTYVSGDSATVTLDDHKTGTASLTLTEKGGFTFEGLTGGDATMTVYDSSNTSVLSETVTSGKFYTGLDAGQYTVILIQKTALLRSVVSPDYLSELGLTEGTDYLQLSITVKDGEIVTLTDYEVSALDESMIAYVSSAAVTTGLAGGMMPGAEFTLRVNYTVDEMKEVTPGYVQVVFPEGISPVSDRIALVDGTMMTYTYNSSTRTAMVNVSGRDSATVYLYCEAGSTAGAYDISAYLTLSGDILQPLGTAKATVNASSISAPEKTSSEMIVVSGITAANSTVTIYDNGEVIGTAVSNAAGSWSTTVTLAGKLYTYSYHVIYASIESEQFEEALVTEETMVIYDERAIVVKNVTMYNQGMMDVNYETVFDFTSDNTTVPYYSYVTMHPTFTFKAELEEGSDKWIEELYVYTVDNYGDITYVEMTYDESLGVWYGTHDYTDSMMAPTQVGVAYDTTAEYQMIPVDENSEWYEDLAEEYSEYTDALMNVVYDYVEENYTYELDEESGVCVYSYIDSENEEEIEEFSLSCYYAELSEEVTEEYLQEYEYSKLSLENENIWLSYEEEDDGIYYYVVDLNNNYFYELAYKFLNISEESTDAVTDESAISYDETVLYNSLALNSNPDLGDKYKAIYKIPGELNGMTDNVTDFFMDVAINSLTVISLGSLLIGIGLTAAGVGVALDAVGIASGGLAAYLSAQKSVMQNSRLNSSISYRQAVLTQAVDRTYTMLKERCEDGTSKLTESQISEITVDLNYINYQITAMSSNWWNEGLKLLSSAGFSVAGTGTNFIASGLLYIAGTGTGEAINAKVSSASDQLEYNDDCFNRILQDIVKLQKQIESMQNCNKDKEPDPDEQTPALPAEVEHDPSGYVYEAVPSNRLEGVTAVISYNDNGTETVWDASNYNQVNPQITGADGSYKWDVTIGEWKVTFTKDGYLTADTTLHENANEDGWLPVPPPQLEINIGIISTEAPTVTSVTAYTGQIEVVFSQYMDMESADVANVLNAISLTRDGEEVEVTVTAVDTEYNLEGTVQYATRFAIVPADGDISGELILTIDGSAENYAGTSLGTSYTSEALTVIEQPASITAPNSVEVAVHEETSISIELNPCIADKTLTVETLTSGIVSVGEVSVVTDETGKATITVTGELPGTGYIVVTEPISDISITIAVNVVLESSGEDEVAVQPVTAYMEDGTVLTTGMTISTASLVTLVTETEGATIRYTVNDTCPCKETALYYTEPIEITEDTVLRAAAVLDGVYSSTIRLELTVAEAEEPDETGTTEDNTRTSSSSGGTSSYAVNVCSAENGTVTSSHSVAARGATVTLTVSPDAGYALDSLTVSNAGTGATVAVTKVSDTRYTFTMPSAAVSVSASFQPTSSAAHDDCSSEQFTDVDDTAWYHEYIDYVVESGLMNGTSATTFEPDVATTRGMIVTILHRLEDEPAASVAHGFDDVVSESYYADSIAWAAENGIVAGYGDGSFGPDDAITREQMAAILYRYAKYKGYDTTQDDMAIREFGDYDDVSDYALEAMAWCINIGIIQGTDSATIAPQGSATRAQIAAILMRFVESISED